MGGEPPVMIPKIGAVLLIFSLLQITWLAIKENTKVEYVKTAHAAEEPKEVLIKVHINWTRERINEEIDSVAKKYGVSADTMKRVVQCESQYDIDIQSHHKRPDGSQEKSFGLVQIYLPAHTNVTYSEAIDPVFALNFLGKYLAQGQGKLWSCY